MEGEDEEEDSDYETSGSIYLMLAECYSLTLESWLYWKSFLTTSLILSGLSVIKFLQNVRTGGKFIYPQ